MNPSNPVNIRAEDQVSPADASFAELLSEFEQQHRPSRAPGQALQGTVVAVTPDLILVDIGRKMEGVLAPDDFRAPSGEIAVKPGDVLAVSITGLNSEGYYALSKVKVERPKDWSSLERAFAEKRVVGGVVIETIKGGLRVDVGVRAFLPASRSGARDLAEVEKLVGQEIQCKIIKLDVADEDVVVDRRVVLEEEEARARRAVVAALQEGAVVRGTVRSLTDFGAFVDLGGVDGLLHVADMSWTRVAKPSDRLSVGDSLEVKILKINADTRRISLGLKQLMPDPWELAGEKYKGGDRVRGKVVRVAEFGAFVELEPGVEGLIHVSEMSWSKKTRKPSEIVQAGEQVEVVVLGVNTGERRIALGLKQALGDPWDEITRRFPVGFVAEGPVASLQNFGAFVELGDGVEGMIHISDITRAKRLNHPREALAVGQTVRFQVLEVDPGKRRIRLGMKQLEPTTADEYIAEHKVGEVVAGRLVSVDGQLAKVELGEGVHAACRLPRPIAEPASAPSQPGGADVSVLSAMLAARWKQGKTLNAGPGRAEPVRPGQIRSFRIAAMDPAEKRIDLELAG